MPRKASPDRSLQALQTSIQLCWFLPKSHCHLTVLVCCLHLVSAQIVLALWAESAEIQQVGHEFFSFDTHLGCPPFLMLCCEQ